MSDQERHIHSSEGMISEEIYSCIEEYRSFIQKSKNIVRCPEDMSTDSYDEVVVSKGFVDSLTAEEVYSIAKKVYSSWGKQPNVLNFTMHCLFGRHHARTRLIKRSLMLKE